MVCTGSMGTFSEEREWDLAGVASQGEEYEGSSVLDHSSTDISAM